VNKAPEGLHVAFIFIYLLFIILLPPEGGSSAAVDS
jgi:hypothetical protein